MASPFVHKPFPTPHPYGDHLSSGKAATNRPLAMEPRTSARGPLDRILYGNPHPGPMQNLEENRKFEEWKTDVRKWEIEERWERERPKDVIKWREVKY